MNDDHPHDGADPPPAPSAAAPEAGAPASVAADAGALARGPLISWLGILLLFGVGGVLLGQEELAALVAVSGVFIAAQAADRHPRWEWLYQVLSLSLVLLGAAVFVMMGVVLRDTDMPAPLRHTLMAACAASAVIGVLSLLPAFANALVRALFRVRDGSHSLRLAARLTLFCLLFVAPGWFAFRDAFDLFMAEPERFLKNLSLGSGLAGYVILAFASVGFLVRRTAAESLERLGVRRITAAQLALIAIGVVVLFGLNAGGEWAQKRYFPGLWALDRRMTEAIAGKLGMWGALMVGLSAGIGEEITVRGALQPKLGIVLTSLLFAALHVQYTWFGMLMVFGFGLVLGAIRRRTSTSVAIAVHTVYDIAAVLMT